MAEGTSKSDMVLRERELKIIEVEESKHTKRRLEDLSLGDGKFMDKFDPERSARETRKMNRKINTNSSKSTPNMYDEKGVHIESGKDMCDCLELECPGCFFPCPKCEGPKCGIECRCNRKYTISHYDIDGTTITIKNPLL